MADIGEVPSPALVVRATPKEMQMRPAAQQRYCRRRLRIMHQGSDAGYLRVSYELRRNPPDTPTTATINPIVTRRITRIATGLLIEDMRTGYAIRLRIAAKKVCYLKKPRFFLSFSFGSSSADSTPFSMARSFS